MKLLDIAFKDLTRSFRSLFAVGMMVVAPLLLIGLIYFAFGGASSETTDIPQVSVGVVNADNLPADSLLDEPLGVTIRSMFFDDSVESWMTASDYEDEAAARDALDGQEIGVAVLIPEDFTENVVAGKTGSQVIILSDPTLTIAPQVAQNMVTAMLDGVAGGGIAIETVIERQQANSIEPDPNQIPALIERYGVWYADFQRALFHHPDRAALVMAAPAAQGESESPIQKMLGVMMAGQMVFFSFFTGAYSMMSILREDEEGTLPRLFTTPVDRTIILGGKFLAVFLSVVVQGIVLILASHFAFQINWGEPLAVVLTLAGQVIAAAGLGVLLISFVQTTRQSGFVLGGGLTVLGMLGGLFTANIAMPEAFTRLANFTPQGWVIKSWKIVLSGQPVSDLALPLIVLIVMGAAMFVVGALRFRRRFA
ncbi:MAG: ABC transporter permease [Anaerolineaceae bacterium]|nr:ABC transporter permease [Anaerolineaceae bacterium]